MFFNKILTDKKLIGLSFDTPKQVMFKELGLKRFNYGIAYHDYIICGCCGGAVSINDVEEIRVEKDWANLEEAIKGE